MSVPSTTKKSVLGIFIVFSFDYTSIIQINTCIWTGSKLNILLNTNEAYDEVNYYKFAWKQNIYVYLNRIVVF